MGAPSEGIRDRLNTALTDLAQLNHTRALVLQRIAALLSYTRHLRDREDQ